MNSLDFWTYGVVGATFALYIGIAIWARASTTGEFYVAGKGIHPVANGMATAADWMSAASFISMAGLIAFNGYGASVFLMGWTGGYVLLALLLAPYLRKFGKFTVPEFIGDRYYSQAARIVAVICLILASITYVIGQMKGIGVAFSRFLETSYDMGLYIGMAIVFVYAVLGGMKGITYTQIAQYVVLILAYTIPALFISLALTGIVLPQIGLGGNYLPSNGEITLLGKLDQVVTELGFKEYTTQVMGSTLNMFAYTLSLMIGTAGLPHVIIRFFTVPKVKDARYSAGWALVFIAILYTTAPAVGAMARLNFTDTLMVQKADTTEQGLAAFEPLDYEDVPQWFKNWQETGLLVWEDLNEDGKMQYYNDQNEATVAEADALGYKGSEIFHGTGGALKARTRPRHHGVGESGDRRTARLGHRAGGCRWTRRGTLDRGRSAARHLIGDLARSAQGRLREGHLGEERAHGRAYRDGRRDRRRRLPRAESARIRGRNRRHRLRTCGLVDLPSVDDGYLLQEDEQRWCRRGHDRRYHRHPALCVPAQGHLLHPGYGVPSAAARHGAGLVLRHLAECLRCGRRDRQLRRRLPGRRGHGTTAGAHPAPGRGRSRPAWSRRGHQPLSLRTTD